MQGAIRLNTFKKAIGGDRERLFRLAVTALAIILFTLPACTGGTSDRDDNAAVDYYRTGGFAGLTDHLVIDSDGHCRLQRKSGQFAFDLQAADFTQLFQLFQQADFFNLKDEYLPEKPGADLFSYVITYRLAGRAHTVRTMDTSVPASLAPVISQLDKIVSDNSQ